MLIGSETQIGLCSTTYHYEFLRQHKQTKQTNQQINNYVRPERKRTNIIIILLLRDSHSPFQGSTTNPFHFMHMNRNMPLTATASTNNTNTIIASSCSSSSSSRNRRSRSRFRSRPGSNARVRIHVLSIVTIIVVSSSFCVTFGLAAFLPSLSQQQPCLNKFRNNDWICPSGDIYTTTTSCTTTPTRTSRRHGCCTAHYASQSSMYSETKPMDVDVDGVAVAPPPLSSPLSVDLNRLTVKQLRDLIRGKLLNERGLFSRLKKKQDLIDFLNQQQLLPDTTTITGKDENGKDDTTGPPLSSPLPTETQTSTSTSTLLDASTSLTKQQPTEKVTRVGTMPKMDRTDTHSIPAVDGEETIVTNGNNNSNHNSMASPKDVIFENIKAKYPPLRDENFHPAGDGDLDIRQQYHPMLNNSKLSDLDIIFVGTASCTPGVTRGVSCTALRLNWRRRWIDDFGAGAAPPSDGFTGGTWIFDVGEATQVRATQYYHCTIRERRDPLPVDCFIFIAYKCTSTWANDEIQDAGTRPRTQLAVLPWRYSSFYASNALTV